MLDPEAAAPATERRDPPAPRPQGRRRALARRRTFDARPPARRSPGGSSRSAASTGRSPSSWRARAGTEVVASDLARYYVVQRPGEPDRGRDRAPAGRPRGDPRTRAGRRPVQRPGAVSLRRGRHHPLDARAGQLRWHRVVRGPRARRRSGRRLRRDARPAPAGRDRVPRLQPVLQPERRPFAVHARLPVGPCPSRSRRLRALPRRAPTGRGRPDPPLLRREPQPDDPRRPARRDRGGRPGAARRRSRGPTGRSSPSSRRTSSPRSAAPIRRPPSRTSSRRSSASSCGGRRDNADRRRSSRRGWAAPGCPARSCCRCSASRC